MSHPILSQAVQRLRRLLAPRPPADTGDGPLLDRFVRDGDQEAFAALVERHGPLVLGVCRRVLGDAHRAEDALQATFLVLARKAASLDRTRTLAGWLHTVAQRAALRARTNDARRQRVEDQAVNRDRSTSQDEAPWSDVAPVLDAELGRLPEKYRLPLVLCYLQGATHEQAATQLGWPVGTVRGRLARGRDVLRDRLTRRGLALSAAGMAALLTENITAAPMPAALTTTVLATVADAGTAPAALILAEGVLRTMLLNRVKWLAGAVLTAAALLTVTVLIVRPTSVVPLAVAVPLPPGADEAARPTTGRLNLLGVRSIDHIVNGRQELVKPELAVVVQVPPGKDEAALAWFDGADGPRPARPLIDRDEVRKAPANNTFTPLAPKTGVRTCVLLASPLFQARGYATLSALSRQKNVFTLTVQTWTDNGDYGANRLFQKLDLVPLGDLAAGDYDLQIVCEDLFQDFRKRPADIQFHLRGRQAATLRFTVAAANAAALPAGASGFPSLNRDQLRPVELPAEDRGRAYQQPRADSYLLRSHAGTADPVKANLQVGTFDRNTWNAAAKAGQAPVPRLEPPRAETYWHAVVVGGELPTSGGVSLRAVEWRGQEAILHMDLWVDPVADRQKTGLAVAVVPLTPERRWLNNSQGLAIAGEYVVRVDWSVWTTASAGGPYQPVAANEVQRYLPGNGKDKYEARFTIR